MEREQNLSGLWWMLAAIRFGAELGMLAALGYAGWRLAGGERPLAVLLAVAPILAAAAVWARWVAPRASHRLDDPARLAVELLLFLAAAGLLVAVGSSVPAVVLAAAYLVSAPAGRKGL